MLKKISGASFLLGLFFLLLGIAIWIADTYIDVGLLEARIISKQNVITEAGELREYTELDTETKKQIVEDVFWREKYIPTGKIVLFGIGLIVVSFMTNIDRKQRYIPYHRNGYRE